MSTTLSDFGISLTLPDGWYGEIFRVMDGVHDSGPLVHFANSPLILGDRNGFAGPARQTMRPGDAIVCVWNMPSLPQLIAMGGERVGPTQGWSLLDASDATFEGVGADQSSLRKAILVGERIFDLVAFFGAHPPPFRLVARGRRHPRHGPDRRLGRRTRRPARAVLHLRRRRARPRRTCAGRRSSCAPPR